MFIAPGVDIIEVPRAIAPIKGVPTSNTAFVGFFKRGPTNVAIRVTSFLEFERVFGGLYAGFESTYAVHAFFNNGGRVAFIVRVIAGSHSVLPRESEANIPGMSFTAANPGDWGNRLRVGVAMTTDETPALTLLVREYDGDVVLNEEVFTNLSITAGSPRYVETLVHHDSELIRVRSVDGISTTGTVVGEIAGERQQANSLDQLLDAPAASLVALNNGSDGIVPSNTDHGRSAISAISGGPGNGTPTGIPTGMHALNAIAPQVFNIMVLADLRAVDHVNRADSAAVYENAYLYCRRHLAFLLIDTPWDTRSHNIKQWVTSLGTAIGRNSAMYYPPVRVADPRAPATLRETSLSGFVAGLFARVDAERGVWVAAAGTQASLPGTPIEILNDAQQRPFTTDLSVNAIRTFAPHKALVWGARTLLGAQSSQWRYVPIVRLALSIERSVKDGLQFAVFENNNRRLWSTIRQTVGGFMQQLHQQGALQGASASDAWFVRCDNTTTTQADIDQGIVNVLVGFAPVKPAEFVVIALQQKVGAGA